MEREVDEVDGWVGEERGGEGGGGMELRREKKDRKSGGKAVKFISRD